MSKLKYEGISSVRLSAGIYALGKLAGAGITLLLLSLATLGLPSSGGIPQGWPVTPAHAVYAYGLVASLVADALQKLLPARPVLAAISAYPLCGLGAGLWLAAEQGGEAWVCAAAGVLVLLVFLLAQSACERVPALLPVFAFVVPLIFLLPGLG